MTRLVALATAVALAGCSIALTRPGPSEPEPLTWPRCTEHHFWTIADGATAGLAAMGVGTLTQSDDEWAPLGEIFIGAIAVGAATSALIGLGRVQNCRRARAAYEKAALEGR